MLSTGQGCFQPHLTAPHASPVGLSRLFPCCRRLASPRMSMSKVANSLALNLASFCRPWGQEREKGGEQGSGCTGGWCGLEGASPGCAWLSTRG